MDSVTQFALGAVVGTAVLGRRMGVRRAALTGGLLGTLPDLDVYLPAADPVDSFVSHRGASHSLVVHAVLTPVIGEGLVRLFAALRGARGQVYHAVFLCLATHALLDAMTVYGTRLFWPLWPEPLGLGSIFIIDPLYTLPLLVMMLWAFCQRDWSMRFRKGVVFSLTASTLYLGWTVAAQQIAEARGTAYLAAREITPELTTAGPTPLNSLFWRLIAVDGSQYYTVYIPLLGSESTVTAYKHPRWTDDVACWAEQATAGEGLAGILARFADGFYQITSEDRAVVVSDLRMGLFPRYVFRFAVAEHAADGITDTAPRRLRSARQGPGDMDWLVAGVLGRKSVRLAEAERLFEDGNIQIAAVDRPSVQAC